MTLVALAKQKFIARQFPHTDSTEGLESPFLAYIPHPEETHYISEWADLPPSSRACHDANDKDVDYADRVVGAARFGKNCVG